LSGLWQDGRLAGLRKKQERERLRSRRIDAATRQEDGGVTQRSSRRFELASVTVGQKPHEGRQPWFAIGENAASFAIETLKRPLFCPRRVPEGPRHGDGGEAHERRAREHALIARPENALKRNPGVRLPCRIERSKDEQTPIPGQPQERSWRIGARRGAGNPTGPRAKQDVERV